MRLSPRLPDHLVSRNAGENSTPHNGATTGIYSATISVNSEKPVNVWRWSRSEPSVRKVRYAVSIACDAANRPDKGERTMENPMSFNS